MNVTRVPTVMHLADGTSVTIAGGFVVVESRETWEHKPMTFPLPSKERPCEGNKIELPEDLLRFWLQKWGGKDIGANLLRAIIITSYGSFTE